VSEPRPVADGCPRGRRTGALAAAAGRTGWRAVACVGTVGAGGFSRGGEEAAAITAFTVNTLRHASDSRDESPCQCVSELAAALVSADPEHAAETRGMLTDRFPDCTSPVTAALEDTLAASTGPDDAPLQPIMPWRQPSIGENGGKNRCQRNCSPIEPPNSAAVSLTKN
jgi:hypothetical protein